MTPEQLQQFNEMYQFFQDLQASHSIPLAVDQSIRARFLKNLITTVASSALHPANREQTTNAGGGDVVPQVFTDFIQCNFNGLTVYIPYYT